MKRTLFQVAALGLGLSSLAWGQDGADPLFVNPEPDSPADTTQKVPLEAFSGQSLKFFETLTVDGYFITGYKESGEVVTSPYNALNFGFGSDVRLDRTARAYSSFYLSYPDTSVSPSNMYNVVQSPVPIGDASKLTFSNIKIKELFLDYSVGTVAIVRLGAQTATWGQGRLFNPGNLVEGIGDGVAAKVSAAVGPFTVTGVAIKNDGKYLGGSTNLNIVSGLNSVATAALAEYSGDWFSLGFSGFYHYAIGEKADVYFKSSFLGADLFLDGLGEWGPSGAQSYTAVAGLYRDFGEKEKWLKLQAEWLVSGRGSAGAFGTVTDKNLGFSDQTVGLAATTDLFGFLNTKPSVLWLHTFTDSSGQVIVGLVNNALPHIDLTLGLARVYGASDSRYIGINPDSQGRTWSLTLKATFNFDIKS